MGNLPAYSTTLFYHSARGRHRLELQAGIAAPLFRQGAEQPISHIGLLIFQHRQAGGRLGDTLQHQSLDLWYLLPVVNVLTIPIRCRIAVDGTSQPL